MRKTFETCSGTWKRSGLTLIEVVASLGLLATLLVSLMQAHTRHARQMETARRRIAAGEAADRLLQEWFSNETPLLVDQEGEFSECSEFRWRTRRRSEPALERVGTMVLVLEVFEALHHDGHKPLTSVELVIATTSRSDAARSGL